MSEVDICKYGTPFEPLDEDELPRAKPVSIEEQYALDESGRRRFHGAFTGGFSAGFCNTVGSLEGWTPSSFKSSRSNKAESRFQKPEDYMDTEDREEWGIAPKRLQATNDYSENTLKKKRFIGPSSVIPGDPILHSLLVPPSNNIGVRLLKSLGWREGQGTGPRRAAVNKNQEQAETEEEQISTFMNISYGPNDCGQFEYIAKLDTFGMGYSGLDRKTFNKPFSLFEPATLNIIDKNKKLSISGQAFGVGTFEDEDEDIYHREDMTQYDFTLEDVKKMQAKKRPVTPISAHHKCIEGFSMAANPQMKIKIYLLPDVPRNYVPTCGRRTRFGPAIRATQNNEQSKRNENYLRKGLGRHDLDPKTRREIMQDSNVKVLQIPGESDESEKRELLLQAANITSKLGAVTTFKPFAADPEKEKRYNCFLSFNKESRISKLRLLQPLNMTEWERDRECREFEQAARLYKPLEGLMSDRFVSGGSNKEDQMQSSSLQAEEEAARSKMFGKLTRKIELWQPVSLLCKRFNVPEPLGGCATMDELDKKSTNFTVFDYAETSLHHRKNYENKHAENIKQMDISCNNLETSSDNNSETSVGINRSLPLETHDRTEEKLNRKVSEFEKKIEANLSTKLPENKNLFKLIFADSSDSEEELNQTDKSIDTMNEMKSFLLSNENVNSKISNIQCEEISKQVNTNKEQQTTKSSAKKLSPSGIFANIDLDLLKNGGKKNICQAPSKNEQLNAGNLSDSKNALNKDITKNARHKNRMQESSTNEFEPKEKKRKETAKETQERIEFDVHDEGSSNTTNNRSDFTTSTSSNLNSLEIGQRKFIFNAPSKTKQLDLNTFSTTKISTIKNALLQSLQSETKSENLLPPDLINITKHKRDHAKSKKKKSKNKHKSKDKKKEKKKTKRSRKDKKERKED